LAIKELDPTLLSNLNFRNPDAFKIMVTNSGLEELRLILHYQTMHKHALVVATRANQAVMDPHLRVQSELEMIKQNKALPNMALCLSKVFSRTSDGIDTNSYNSMKTLFNSNLDKKVSECIQSITAWKAGPRSNLAKQYQQFLALCERKHQNTWVKLRVLRSYKVQLFSEYCSSVLEDVYTSSIKLSIFDQVKKLRVANQYF
jgi:hypothetical protein